MKYKIQGRIKVNGNKIHKQIKMERNNETRWKTERKNHRKVKTRTKKRKDF